MFLTGIFLWVCVGAYSYLFLYEDVDVYGEYEVVFFWYVRFFIYKTKEITQVIRVH